MLITILFLRCSVLFHFYFCTFILEYSKSFTMLCFCNVIVVFGSLFLISSKVYYKSSTWLYYNNTKCLRRYHCTCHHIFTIVTFIISVFSSISMVSINVSFLLLHITPLITLMTSFCQFS